MKIVLKGAPKSTGSIYRSVCRGKFPSVYMSNEGKALKESYQWQAKAQHRGEPTTADVEIDVWLYLPTKRRADIDNFNKILFDALTGIVWVDDSQVMDSHTHKRYDKKDPRIEVSVKRLQI